MCPTNCLDGDNKEKAYYCHPPEQVLDFLCNELRIRIHLRVHLDLQLACAQRMTASAASGLPAEGGQAGAVDGKSLIRSPRYSLYSIIYSCPSRISLLTLSLAHLR